MPCADTVEAAAPRFTVIAAVVLDGAVQFWNWPPVISASPRYSERSPELSEL